MLGSNGNGADGAQSQSQSQSPPPQNPFQPHALQQHPQYQLQPQYQPSQQQQQQPQPQQYHYRQFSQLEALAPATTPAATLAPAPAPAPASALGASSVGPAPSTVMQRRPTLFRKDTVGNGTFPSNNGAPSQSASQKRASAGSGQQISTGNSNSLSRRNTLRRNGTLSRSGNPQPHPPVSNMLAKPLENSRPTPWVVFSWAVTCCFPAAILSSMGVKTRGSQQAWREKVALCLIAAVLSATVIYFLVFFNNNLCPANLLDNTVNVNVFGGVVVFGVMYNAYLATPPYNTLFEQTDAFFGGIDVSGSFEQPAIPACKRPSIANAAFASLKSTCAPNCINLTSLVVEHNFNPYATISNPDGRNFTVLPTPAYQWSQVKERKLVIIRQSVLNLQPYFNAYPDPIDGDNIDSLLRRSQAINDATHILWENSVSSDVLDCLMQKYSAGVLAQLPMTCILSRIGTVTISLVVLSILFTRFIMALFFDWFLASKMIRPPRKIPHNAHAPVAGNTIYMNNLAQGSSSFATREGSLVSAPVRTGTVVLRQDPSVPRPVSNTEDLYTVLFVTCYSESEQSLRTTLDALAATDYDDCKKLLFIVADGLVKGSGNAESTPDMLMNMMNHDMSFGDSHEAYSYVAIATGPKQHNTARVYCGSYEYKGRHVPMILVVKCGTSSEASQSKPGNRGKRDSQLILMNFFSRVVLNDRMTPLDYDIFRKIHHLTGVTPDQFDLVLMVDADTFVARDSLRFMVNAMHNDQRIMGLCGETRIANKHASWVTRIQVFEYFISHHMGKAFESVFGGVTCLPGCFCMYRIKVQKDDATLPILVNPDIIEQYSTNEVFTLHQKNLLLLGEDRFLTTLMLRTFPKRHTVFLPSATCKTTVPEQFSILVSQRRRWINSTIHNLMELVFVNNLCGTFCFSMQFIVFMDLIGTAVLPASLLCTYYLIFAAIFKVLYSDITSYLNLSMMIITIFLPMLLVLLTARRLQYILWMLIYLVALPIWQVILPLYAFWHFDDFSWGETRKVTGDVSSNAVDDDHGLFDGSQIPFKRWDEYELEWRREVLIRSPVDKSYSKSDSESFTSTAHLSAMHSAAPLEQSYGSKPPQY